MLRPGLYAFALTVSMWYSALSILTAIGWRQSEVNEISAASDLPEVIEYVPTPQLVNIMAQKNDDRIMQLKEQIEKKRKELAASNTSRFIPITNCLLVIDKTTYNALEEYYNLKLSNIAKELYLQGFKDGVNLMLDIKEKQN